MRQAVVFNYGMDGKAIERVRETAHTHGVPCRDFRDARAVLRSLQKAGHAVVVVRIGRALEEELGLVQKIHRLYPDTRTIVLADSDNPAIAGLAWELGASFVLSKPLPWELLPDLVAVMLPAEARIELIDE